MTGIVGLGVTLVLETLETLLGMAVTMSGFLLIRVVLCVSLLACGLGGLVGGRARRFVNHDLCM